MHNHSFDVAIVGAGPAGCSAGITLARHGAKVLLLDRADFPREKLCGGLLTEKTCSIISNKLALHGLANKILHKCNGFEIYDKKQFINSVTTDSNLYFISRKSFDNYLLENALHAGCAVLTGTEITNLESNRIVVGDKFYKFNYLIGADGVHSLVRRYAGISLPKNNVAIGLQIDIPIGHIQSFSNSDMPKIYFGYIKYGWGWAFPKNDHMSIGLAGLFSKGANARDAFEKLLGDLSCHDRMKECQIRGGLIPCGSYVSAPCKDNIFLVGDAAGFVDPLTGEGIYNALLSGIMAAEVLIDNEYTNKVSAYKHLCHERIIKPIRQGLLARWFLFEEPFRSLSLKKLHGNPNHMILFMDLLAGSMDYMDYFRKIIGRKFLPS